MNIISLLIFFAILFVLVIVHEAGHFIFAKLMKMRVDEFAFGFPPKIFSFKRGETKYSFNLIPLGGFVKIHGENNLDDASISEEQKDQNKKDEKRSFDSKSSHARIFVLLGGVIFNVIATAIFFSTSYFIGEQAAISTEEAKAISSESRSVVINSVSEESNLYKQGLRKEDKIISVNTKEKTLSGDALYAASITELSTSNTGELIYIKYISKENGDTKDISAIPQAGIVEGKKVLGLSLVDVSYVKLTAGQALEKGVKDTYNYTALIFTELGKLVYGSIFGKANVQDSLSGPIGLAVATKDISEKNLATILFFAGILSLSLAVFNILPIPALDGGRILFVLLEAPSKWIFKKKISKTIEQTFHSFGFLFLIGLMIYVSYFDVIKLLV
jgi:regulator of sigma E protease